MTTYQFYLHVYAYQMTHWMCSI